MLTQQQINKELILELAELRAKFTQCKEEFETERNIKNYLYYFILSNNLLEALVEFQCQHDEKHADFYTRSLQYLVDHTPDS